jgi:hypothetical protein
MESLELLQLLDLETLVVNIEVMEQLLELVLLQEVKMVNMDLEKLHMESQVKLLDQLIQFKIVVIKLKKNNLNLFKLNQQQHLK